MDSGKAKKLAKLLDFQQRFKENAPIAILSENEKVIQAIEEIKTDSQKIVEAVGELDQKKANKTDVENILDSIPRIIGPRGFKGNDGRSPLTVSKTEPLNPQKGDLWYQD